MLDLFLYIIHNILVFLNGERVEIKQMYHQNNILKFFYLNSLKKNRRILKTIMQVL